MADVLACGYRFVRNKGTEENPQYERVVLNVGDKASNLPSGVAKELKKTRQVVDESEIGPNKELLPVGHQLIKVAQSEAQTESDTDTQSKTTAKKETGTKSSESNS